MSKLIKHEPKQTRSTQMKEKILNTSLSLFCSKGYASVTTNEIAKTAGISIGTLYFHFHDKESILYEILDIYNNNFLKNINMFKANPRKDKITKENFSRWLTKLINTLIKMHKETKDFNYELKSIYYLNKRASEIIDSNNKHIYSLILNSLSSFNSILNINDIEVQAMLIQDIISCSVDRVVFGKNRISQKRIVENSVNSILLILGLN